MQVYANSNLIQADLPVKRQNSAAANTSSQAVRSFGEVLNEKITESRSLQFSKHASLRLSSRELNLSGDQLKRVEDGIAKAHEKGINDSLILVDSVALVVNIRNKVVVTAMNNDTENIFTNIDGAVIV